MSVSLLSSFDSCWRFSLLAASLALAIFSAAIFAGAEDSSSNNNMLTSYSLIFLIAYILTERAESSIGGWFWKNKQSWQGSISTSMASLSSAAGDDSSSSSSPTHSNRCDDRSGSTGKTTTTTQPISVRSLLEDRSDHINLVAAANNAINDNDNNSTSSSEASSSSSSSAMIYTNTTAATANNKSNQQPTSLNQSPHVHTGRSLIPRYTGPSDDDMTIVQKKIRDEIVKTRPRTGLSGPFGPWLAVPKIAEPAQTLGKACRYDTSLTFRESELVILLTGAKTKSHAEFDIHVGEALKAGLSTELIASIPRDDDFSLTNVERQVLPHLTDSFRERAIVRFTAELLDTCHVSDETYETTKEALGGKDSALVEITSIAGYYTYVAYTLNVFRIPSK